MSPLTDALGAEMISNQLLDRLSHQAALILVDKVRKGRRHATLLISRYRVGLTDDRRGTHEVIFDQLPTIGLLEARVGPDAWVVSVKMRPVPRGARQRRAVAAE